MRRPLGAELATPEAFFALLVLCVNDHLLKGSGLLPGWLTGKLSDFAGLFLFPVLLFVMLSAVFSAKRERLAFTAAALTSLGFTLVKLSPSVNGWVSGVWGPMRLDASDLAALPMTLLAGLWLVPRRESISGATLRAVAFVATALACAATSRPMTVRNYPKWQLEKSSQHVGCAKIDAWVSKSGKEGVGINLRVASSRSDRCNVEILSGVIDVGGKRVPLPRRPAPLNPGAPVFVYLPFPFDNERAWNEGRRTARLELRVKTSSGGGFFASEMQHEWDGEAHVWSPRAPEAPPAPDASVSAPPDQAFQLEPSDAGAWE
jgi:hypothetical protein